jgi:hypothetical protein
MAGEVGLVVGDALDPADRLEGDVLDGAIDQEEGIAVRQAAQDFGGVDGLADGLICLRHRAFRSLD